MRRIPTLKAPDLDAVADHALARTPESPLILIFDADNTLVRQGAPVEEFAERVNEVIDRFESLPGVERVIVLSNGPPRGVDRMIARGNKPWIRRRRIGVSRGDRPRTWVVGDQVVTDGVLAWRIGSRYLELSLDPDDDYPRQRRMRRLGRIIAPLILRR